ncbi:hypothetical protein [Roseateles sp. MS654]|uniref:hypothetical protein n=1 Tax=Roseateles sp. MS654 TaxID=3412685 RepID=UPI003C2DF0B3
MLLVDNFFTNLLGLMRCQRVIANQMFGPLILGTPSSQPPPMKTISPLSTPAPLRMRDVFELERGTEILSDDPYIATYSHLLAFFEPKSSFNASDVVCGAHMVYGWMPTILELYPDADRCDLAAAAAMLTKAKLGHRLDAWELEALAGLMNNSVVGVSKLLHFVAPQNYAIWDSKVFAFVRGERPHHYRVNSVHFYQSYLEELRNLVERPGFEQFHASMNKKIGYAVSPLRALELVMFLNAPIYRA